MDKHIFLIEGMHCNGCANTIKNVLHQIEGTTNVEVSFEESRASLLSEHPIEINALNNSLVSYGDFKLTAIN